LIIWQNIHPDISMPEQGNQLVAETKDYRYKRAKPLAPEQSENVILLSRLILEQTFPGLCPNHDC
jgi:hypothetical protein